MSITPAKLAQLFCTNLKLQEYQGLAGLRFVSSSELNSLVDTKLSHLQARISRFFSDSRDFQKNRSFNPQLLYPFPCFLSFRIQNRHSDQPGALWKGRYMQPRLSVWDS